MGLHLRRQPSLLVDLAYPLQHLQKRATRTILKHDPPLILVLEGIEAFLNERAAGLWQRRFESDFAPKESEQATFN